MKLAAGMHRLGTETAFEVLLKARQLEAQGKKCIHLEIGEPDFDTPQNIIEAAIQALRDGYTHYSPSPGIPQLREAVAEHISRSRGISVDAQQVVVTPGAKPIMFFTILALVEPGDEVLYPNPGFPIYESMINFIGATAVPIHLREEEGFRLDVEELRRLASSRTKLIILNYPENPTGGVLSREDLEAVAEVAIKQDAMVLSDEIYEGIQYEGTHTSIASLPDMKERTIILDGFSKAYAMTGWRLGYGVMNEQLAIHIARLMTNSNSCTATFTQRAGVEALRGPQDAVEKMVAEFRKRRDTIVAGLNQIPGFRCQMPKGAFYVFPNIQGTGMSERELADYLLYEAGVATLAGTAFGEFGKGYLRISYANSIANIQEALAWIKEAVSRRVPA